MKVSKFFLLSLFVVLVAQIVYFYPQLPATVPIHFGLNGEADRWASKSAWLIFQLILVGILSIVTFGLPKLIEKNNDSFINLPNKEYWLAPERRAETMAKIGNHFQYLGIALFALFNFLTFDTVQAALTESNRLSDFFWLYFVGFLGFMVIWTFKFCRKFEEV